MLGDPRTALTNELGSLGIPLREGLVVTTGICATPLPVAPGDEVTMDFGELGKVYTRFVGGVTGLFSAATPPPLSGC